MDREKEIREAIRAADYAITKLQTAGDYLRSARNWGIVDILGGGLLSTYIKRRKMDEASQCMLDARRALAQFRDELDDVDTRFSLSVDQAESELWRFADYFFDGFIADFAAQDRIARAWNQVDDAIAKVTLIRDELKRMA
ncbi:MAG: hypothetical protein IKI54_01585 [Lachnospiraceae bacterium]|nr:hypothetical protein [Lachnospiraceae bacterium]